jgi:predicted metal-dependent hydrolase
MTYTVLERNVKYPRLEFKNGNIVAVVPPGRSYLAESLLIKHKAWIVRSQKRYDMLNRDAQLLTLQTRTQNELSRLITRFIERAAVMVAHQPREVRYRAMKRRWGSCSLAGDIVFNKRLAFLPEQLIWYVVFHEMCHLLIPAHNKKFNQLMRTQISDIAGAKQQLRSYTIAIEKNLKTNYDQTRTKSTQFFGSGSSRKTT